MQRKRVIICIVGILIAITAVNAQETVLSAFEQTEKITNVSVYFGRSLRKLNLSIKNEIPEYNLSAIQYILKNTYENNIHKMRGETENKVYTHEGGMEAVFDKDGTVVTNAWNKGSYNYGSYDKPIGKFLLDILPWLAWGNGRDDPTSFDERFFYYCQDLDNGIQSYIFIEDRSKLEKIKYSDLPDDEKETYHFFNYLLFNSAYTVTLEEKNIKNLQKDGAVYWRYFDQIMKTAGFEK